MTFTVTLTGTGAPRPRPGRAGAGTLVQVDDEFLQFDAGRATALRLAEAGVRSADLAAMFLTHHHSDHLSSVAEMLITRWIEGGSEPLEILAPDGPLTTFGDEILDVWRSDIEIRRRLTGRAEPEYSWQPFHPTPEPAEVWAGRHARVQSCTVQHHPVLPAVGYRVDAGDHSVVVSGDTTVCEEVERMSQGATVLVHEVIRKDLSRADGRPQIVTYHSDPVELGAMAQRAGVETLILTHLEPPPESAEEEQVLIDHVRSGGFDGTLLVGRDLLSFDVETREADFSACPPLRAFTPPTPAQRKVRA